MRRFILLIPFIALLFGCSKQGGNNVKQDDSYLGNYSYVESWSTTVDGEKTEGESAGTFTISRNGELGVSITGDFNTVGIVNGNMLTFVDNSLDVEKGELTYYYKTAIFNKGKLTFTYACSGRVPQGEYGLLSYYRKVGEVTAVKQ